MTRFSLTLPDELKNEIAERAKQNGRSMTQEIVAVLSQPAYDLKIGRLEVKPGDVLVAKAKGFVDNVSMTRYAAYAKAEVPDGVGVLVVDDGVELVIVSKVVDD